jgi:LysR family nitrogen assimilation transcriptional regulator
MDHKQLRYFVAVFEEGSLSKAALREHCTQPGLTMHIQQLEHITGQKLFERTARGVTPTIAGRHFYDSCTKVLRSVRDARQKMIDLAGNLSGNINIGVPPSLSKGPLPEVLGEYLRTHPYIDVRLAEAYSGTLCEWVAAGNVDMAIVTEPPERFGLESSHFYRDQLVLVRRYYDAPPESRNGKSWTSDELRNLKLVVPSRLHSLRKAIERHIRSSEGGLTRIVEIDGLISTIEFVRNSEWATILPAVAIIDDVRRQTLCADPIVDPVPWLDYYLIQAKDRPASVATGNFIALLKGILERSPREWLDQRLGNSPRLASGGKSKRSYGPRSA